MPRHPTHHDSHRLNEEQQMNEPYYSRARGESYSPRRPDISNYPHGPQSIDETVEENLDDSAYGIKNHSRSREYNITRNMADELTTLHTDVETPVVTAPTYSVDESETSAASRKYDNEKYNFERSAINDAQSVAYTAFTMNLDSGQTIVKDLRNVGVTVLSLESLSTAAMIHYMDAVTTMRLGNENDEKCMLYTDRMGRVFNVIISGGAEGLSQRWATIESAFSGWLAIAIIPFTVRVIASYSYANYATNTLAIPPTALLFCFGFILPNETSQTWLAMSIMVRGTNSVGSHVWRTTSLVDYPRVLLLTLLTLASMAPNDPSIFSDTLTLGGASLGAIILLCNLGSRAWKKLEIGYVDSQNIISLLIVVITSLLSGLTFPYIALHNVHGGTDESDEEAAIEKVIFNPNGKRARQNVTFASCNVALVFLLSDIKPVQEALGFDFVRHRGFVNLAVGVWWFLSTLASLGMCHRLDTSKSKKIQPFLKKDETSPVGYIVPSVPNIVIHPNLSTGKMILPFLSYGSDMVCVILIIALASLIMWTGINEIQSGDHSSYWGFIFPHGL